VVGLAAMVATQRHVEQGGRTACRERRRLPPKRANHADFLSGRLVTVGDPVACRASRCRGTACQTKL
jgi:hypothetical protein